MKQKHRSTLVAGLLVVSLGLAGCAAMRGDDGLTDLGDNTSGGLIGASGASGVVAYGAGNAIDASGAAPPQAGIASAAAPAPNSTVLNIELVPAASAEAMGAVGASGAAGATGSNLYRVTVRMDDGSTQVLTYGSTPDFRSGDRVNVTGGRILR